MRSLWCFQLILGHKIWFEFAGEHFGDRPVQQVFDALPLIRTELLDGRVGWLYETVRKRILVWQVTLVIWVDWVGRVRLLRIRQRSG